MNQFQPLIDLREAIGGTRFILAAGAGVVNTVLLCCGVLSESGYVTLTLSTVAAFITAGTVQDVMNKGKS